MKKRSGNHTRIAMQTNSDGEDKEVGQEEAFKLRLKDGVERQKDGRKVFMMVGKCV